MFKKIYILKIIFYFSTLLLIVFSLFPGSITGLFFHGDLHYSDKGIYSIETTRNHFISYIYLSMLGLYTYLNQQNFKEILFFILALSIILELLQYFIPNRSFEILDLLANIMGVATGYFIIRFYKLRKIK